MLTDGGSEAVTTFPLLPVFCTIAADPELVPLLVIVRAPPDVSLGVLSLTISEPPLSPPPPPPSLPPPLSTTTTGATRVMVVLPPLTLAPKVPLAAVTPVSVVAMLPLMSMVPAGGGAVQRRQVGAGDHDAVADARSPRSCRR